MPHRSDRVQLTAFAKGRVERAHLTLQDRLVKELRLRGINTVADANAYALTFMATYNARFAKPPKSDFDAHRPLRADENLDLLMTWRETRRVTKSLTVQYDRVMYLLDDPRELFGDRTGHYIGVPSVSIDRIHSPSRLVRWFARCMTARAPCTSKWRRCLSPRLLIPRRTLRPPVLCCRGTSPIEAAKLRPPSNCATFPTSDASSWP